MAKYRRDILTIHLNDYFQGGALSSVVPRRHWPRFERRIERTTRDLLDLLDRHNDKATFFANGWIADNAADILREITARGHEIASTGYYQRTLAQMSPAEFRADAVRSRHALEQACGREVLGYRIARGWVGEKDLWILDILSDEGFRYDTSLCAQGFTGIDARHAVPHERRIKDRTIWELPVPTSHLMGFHFPIAGGNYVRQLPSRFMRAQVDHWHDTANAPWMLYFQVAELDVEQPRITALGTLPRLRQYRNLDTMQARIEHYMNCFKFTSVADHLGIVPAAAIHAKASQAVAPISVASVASRPAVTIVVPCFNEETSLKYTENALIQFEAEHGSAYDLSYIFIDDGSTDGTLALLHDLARRHANWSIVQHNINRGIAAATLTGLKAARSEIVCVMDCDCSYDPAVLARLIPLLTPGVALVTASPYHPDGAVLNVPGWRLLLSRGLSFLYRRVLTNKLATYTACVRAYRRSAVVDLEIRNGGFLGVAEIVTTLDAQGAKIAEAPAVLEARLLGNSKMKIARTIAGHLGLLGRLIAKRITSRLPAHARELS